MQQTLFAREGYLLHFNLLYVFLWQNSFEENMRILHIKGGVSVNVIKIYITVAPPTYPIIFLPSGGVKERRRPCFPPSVPRECPSGPERRKMAMLVVSLFIFLAFLNGPVVVAFPEPVPQEDGGGGGGGEDNDAGGTSKCTAEE